MHALCRKSYPDYKEANEDDESVEMDDNDDDVGGSSSTEVDASGYQLVLPSGNYMDFCTVNLGQIPNNFSSSTG